MTIYDATVTSKGQTTIPVEIREKLKLKPGDKIRFVMQGDKIYLRAKNKKAADLAGILHDPDRPPFSLQDIDEAIGEYLEEKDQRIKDDWHRLQRSS